MGKGLLLALFTSAAMAQILLPTSMGTAICCTYYLDQSGGNDSNSGRTPSLAWKTLSKLNGTTLKPCDTIGLKRGATWNEQLTPGQSGTAVCPITYLTYGSGAQPIIQGGGTNYGAYINTKNYITIKNLTFTNTTKFGICLDTGTFIILDAITATGSQDTGICIGAGSHDVVIKNSTVTSNGSVSGLDNDGIGIGEGGAASFNILITLNTITGNYGDNVHVSYTATSQIPHDIVISYNTIASSLHANGFGIDGGTAVSLNYNVIYGNTVGANICPGTGETITSQILYNNTFNTNTNGAWYSGPCGGTLASFTMRNNLSLDNTNAEYGAENFTNWDSDYNLAYHTAGGSFMYFGGMLFTWSLFHTAAVGQGDESHSINVNPTVVNAATHDYNLQGGSPAIGAGIFISGVSTASPPNIGAK